MRDNYHTIRRLGGDVFGMSTQSTSYQQEAANRLHLPFALLSDQQLKMTHALRLPTFEVQGWTLIKRLTIVIHQGKIEKVFYPVFPPDKHGRTGSSLVSKKAAGPHLGGPLNLGGRRSTCPARPEPLYGGLHELQRKLPLVQK